MYLVIRTPEDFAKVKEELNIVKPVFCDTETCEEYAKTKPKGGLYGQVRLFQIYQEGWPMAFIFDCFFIPLQDILDLLGDFHLVWHNGSYDLHTINCHTGTFWCPDHIDDTFYLAKAKWTDKKNFDFYSCLRYAKVSDDVVEGIDKKENQKYDWSGYIGHKQFTYAACDVLYLWLLYDKIKDAKDELYDLDIRNLRYAVRYDRNGFPIDRSVIRDIIIEQMPKLEDEMRKLPPGFNPNSSVQVKKYLDLPKTDADTLADAALNGNEGAHIVLKARRAGKILQFAHIYNRDRMYAFHNACGARTSRMTCAGGDRYGYVNLQQPPRRLYPSFVAPPGKKLVYADFSGLELRMGAAYVGEPTLERLFKEGLDVHTLTGEFLFDCGEGNLQEVQRWASKMVSFTTIYGGGAATVQGIMQKQGGVRKSIEEIKELQKRWLEFYPYFKEWHGMHGKMLQVYGYVDTKSLLGRIIRATTYTESFNFPIQSSGAEVLKMSIDKLHSYGDIPPIANVVHDSITMEVDEEDGELWGERLTEAMQWGWQQVVQRSAIPDMPMVIDTVVSTVLGVKDDAEKAYDYGIAELVI